MPFRLRRPLPFLSLNLLLVATCSSRSLAKAESFNASRQSSFSYAQFDPFPVTIKFAWLSAHPSASPAPRQIPFCASTTSTACLTSLLLPRVTFQVGISLKAL